MVEIDDCVFFRKVLRKNFDRGNAARDHAVAQSKIEKSNLCEGVCGGCEEE